MPYKFNPFTGNLDIEGPIITGTVISAADGTAQVPGINFTSDLNTGIYRPGADQLAISTNGTGRLFVDSSGSVGVGTSTPAAILHSVATSTGAVSETLRLQNLSDGLNAGTEIMLASNNVPHVKIQQLVTGPTAGNRGSDCLFFTKADGGSISERLRITSAGLVGIGTSSPGEKLTVAGNISLSAAQPYIALIDSNWGYGSTFRSGVNTLGTATGDYQLFNVPTGKGFAFAQNNATNSLVIDSSNRVGIGTTSPAGTLHLAATYPLIYLTDTNATGSARSAIGSPDGNLAYFANENNQTGGNHIFYRNGNSESARLDSSGRLLVGTSSARTDLIAGTRGGRIQLEAASANVNTAIDDSSLCLTAGNSNSVAAGPYIFLTRTYSNSIGGVAAVTENTVLGGLYFQGTDGTDTEPAALIRAEVDGTPGTNDMPGRLVFSTTADGASSPTERMRIGSNGTISTNQALSTTTVFSIRNSTNSGSQTVLEIQGGTYTTSDTTSKLIAFKRNDGTEIGSVIRNGTTTVNYATSSDYRLKENIEPLSNALTKVNSLKPSRFNFIGDTRTVDGFIAHEVQSIVPEAVTGEKDAVDDEGNPVYQGIDQSKLVPLLTAALQEAVAKIETLEQRLNDAGIN